MADIWTDTSTAEWTVEDGDQWTDGSGALSESISESIALSDSVEVAAVYSDAVSDAVALDATTDAKAPEEGATDDPIGLADSADVGQMAAVSAADIVGLADAAGRTVEADRVALDAVGLADAASVGSVGLADIDDPVALAGLASFDYTTEAAAVDPVALADSSDREFVPHGYADAAVGLADAAEFDAAFEPIFEIRIGVRDAVEAFNLTGFLRDYADEAVKRYHLYLEAPGLEAIELPIASFQATIRAGNPTFLSAVCPDPDYFVAAEARRAAGGWMTLQMAWIWRGSEVARETLSTVDLDDVRLDEGPRGGSVTVDGRRVETYLPKTIEIRDVRSGGQTPAGVFYRCRVDMLARPGDLATIGEDQFTVGTIQYVVGVLDEYMDIRQAAA